MFQLLLVSSLLVAIAIQQVSASTEGFHLVQSTDDSLIFNYVVTLAVNQSSCINMTDLVQVPDVPPYVDVNVFSTNPDHSRYDISFNFFPARQVIGGVPLYTYYPHSTKIAEYTPQSYWRKSNLTTCSSNTLNVPTLQPFQQICIVNTCQKGQCTSSPINTFKGQLVVHGYTAPTQKLNADPVVAYCGRPTVGEVQYVAYFPTDLWFNFQVTANNSAMCMDTRPSFKVFDIPYSLTVNMSMFNGAKGSDFAVGFSYPDGSVKKYSSQFHTGFKSQTANDVCFSDSIVVNDLTPGWTKVCVGSVCNNPSCDYGTFTGTLIVNGQHITDDIQYVGTVPQTCQDVVYAPTYAPTKEPKLYQGDVAAIILISVFGIIALFIGVWAIVMGFRRLKRRYHINDGSEVSDPGCTWQGWF